MKRQYPAAVNMIAELVFIVSVMLIILGAFFDKFASHPSLAVISVIGFCLSIFSWAFLQNT
jgi:F0F1-type ATP synthase assembly protein I